MQQEIKMAKYLIFQLRGDLASWGDIAVGEQRPTLPFPTKSAILGLIAAALGIKRNEEEKHRDLAKAVHYGVKVFLPEKEIARYNNEFFNNKKTYSGGYMRDYHTIQSPSDIDIRLFMKKNGIVPESRYDEIQALKLGNSEGTILSFREYRLDAYYIVGFTLLQPIFVSIEQIQTALLHPKFHLYLGRKACPLGWPLLPQLIDAEDIQSAIEQSDFKLDEVTHYENFGLVQQSNPGHFYIEHLGVSNLENGRFEEYRTLPRSRTRWQFDTQYMRIIGA